MTFYDTLQLALKSDPATQDAIIGQMASAKTNPALISQFRAALQSHTTMYVIDEDGSLTPYSTFSNAWGSAMLIWEYITNKYFPEVIVSVALLDQKHLKRVWAMADDTTIPLCERVAILSTMDGAMCGREYLPRLATLFMEFSDQTCLFFPATRANTLPEQARAMMKVYEEGWQAICWQQTNWIPPGEESIWDDYNINTDEKHWFIEDDIDDKIVA